MRLKGWRRCNYDLIIFNLGIVEEEADETLFWFEMLLEAKKINETEVIDLIQEVKEIVAIFSASHKTARMNRAK
ncbi:MAG: four helix bundle protein [Bacteroidota bacterium]